MSVVDETRSNRALAYLQALRAAKHGRGDSIPCKIEEGLYLGSVEAALNRDGLKSLNITHVLVVARSLSPAFPDDFVYKKIDVLDSLDTNLREHFDECFDFIDEARRAGGGVLVHCFAGISRSVTIIVAYLMKKHKMTLSQSLMLVKSERPQIAPNQGFMMQLENFEKSLGDVPIPDEYIWTDESTRIFIEICCDEVMNGNRSTVNFGKAWKDILPKFNSATGLDYNENQLKNKLNSLKDDWKIWRALVGKETGLGFINGVIQADPKWWDRKIQEVEGAAKFRGKPLPFETELDYLFTDTVSTGGRAWAPTSRVQTPDNVQSTPLPQPSFVNIIEGSTDSDEVVMETQLPTQLPTPLRITQLPSAPVEDRKGKNIRSARSASGKHKSSITNDLHDTISEIKEIMAAYNSRGAAIDELQKLYGIRNVIQILKSLPGINLKSPAFMQACKAMRSVSTREVFVELNDIALRKNWILSLIESSEDSPLFFSN